MVASQCVGMPSLQISLPDPWCRTHVGMGRADDVVHIAARVRFQGVGPVEVDRHVRLPAAGRLRM
ncbi:hypothetical protein GCM10027073_42010 [Streptomyces chlorus]